MLTFCGQSNGKKVSANAIETKLRASPDVAEAIAFGASKPLLGVLVLPASLSTPIGNIKQCICDVNASSPSFAKIIEEMIIMLPHNADLPKTSKGSIIRPRALKQFTSTIMEAYRRLEDGCNVDADATVLSDEGLRAYIRRLILESNESVTRLTFGDDDDLFNLGVTSLHAIQR